MKKRILILVIMIITGTVATFAAPVEPVDQKISEAFMKEFTGAQDIRWDNGKNFVRATFKLNNQVMFAYYTADAELLAVTRNITTSQLPVTLQAELKNTQQNQWISDLFEMSSNGNTAYYITLESSTYTVVLRSLGAEGWETYSRVKKPA
ncbi:hypothetical protein HHL16_23675 [Pseudoflavitalea sp. G-6-1-2]|uniref:hypothetical protein n=1 Tax=Pseudoflavitalea sp. G-6-1-2 TaxID=2728841 RepID=UPI00146F0522|nr:hypothetical protein [Pseudoflavitalea sp. G-6-1-2]NML23901.1 hypothetical protein [Pseudoflavitalea sp. G-6-1-2]